MSTACKGRETERLNVDPPMILPPLEVSLKKLEAPPRRIPPAYRQQLKEFKQAIQWLGTRQAQWSLL